MDRLNWLPRPKLFIGSAALTAASIHFAAVSFGLAAPAVMIGVAVVATACGILFAAGALFLPSR